MTGLLYHLVGGFARWVESTRRAEFEAAAESERRATFGVCGWCGEVLDRPIHDTDCPARMTEQELLS